MLQTWLTLGPGLRYGTCKLGLTFRLCGLPYLTIWCRTENHILIITGSFPALRPFWRIFIVKCSSYLSPYASRHDTGEQQVPQTRGLELYTIGSKPTARTISKLYSTTMQDNSEEHLYCQREDLSSRTYEGILVNHGNARIGCESHVSSIRTDTSTDRGIKVTNKVQVI